MGLAYYADPDSPIPGVGLLMAFFWVLHGLTLGPLAVGYFFILAALLCCNLFVVYKFLFVFLCSTLYVFLFFL